MNLHDNRKLFTDAVLATAQHLDINPIFVEKESVSNISIHRNLSVTSVHCLTMIGKCLINQTVGTHGQ